jgi:fructuronate reductase
VWLGLDALPLLAAGGRARLPGIDPAAVRVGIVHLGIGAFHRAHQAVYTEDAMVAANDVGWGICGLTQRSAAVRDQLAPQDGLYTVLERGPGAVAPRVVGAVREVRFAQRDPAAGRRIADADVRLVTLTVTEKGYRMGADRRLDLADDAVRADVAGVGDDTYLPRTVVGQLADGLRRRRRSGGPGLTVLSCDNLPANGRLLRGLVLDFCTALPTRVGNDLAGWIERSVAFPSSMVDRMVPATCTADRVEVLRRLDVHDAAVVVAEPFSQWVIEDRFAAGRPLWEAAGAVLAADVTPYETAKLRLLNAAHSLLAYTGALAGHATIAAAVADPALAGAAEALMVEDAGPTLTVPPGSDLDAYRSAILTRFANPALGHRTTQVAADGSAKLPIRLLSTARDRLDAGAEPGWVALAVAAWMVYVARGRDRNGQPLPLDDPLAPKLAAAVDGRSDPAGVVDALLAVGEVFPADLAANPTFRSLLVENAARLLR